MGNAPTRSGPWSAAAGAAPRRARPGRELAVTVRRTVAAPPDVVFGLCSDTNRWDRLIGATPTRYTYDRLDPDDPTSRTRIGHARAFGIPLHFAEEGEYWTPDWLVGERRFRGTLARWLAVGFLEVDVTATDGGARVVARSGVSVRGPIGLLIGVMVWLRFALILRLYLRDLVRAVASCERSTDRPAAEHPAAVAARDVLLSAGPVSRLATGPVRVATRAAIEQRGARLAAAPIDPAIRDRLLDLVRDQPDEVLIAVRPFDVARVWGAPRREVARGFLHAARAGLFDLEWVVDCPVCRVGAQVVPVLDQIGRRLHCDECDVSFDVDFADHVEATFTVNRAVRRVRREVFCASSPSWRPHVHGYVTVAPGQTREVGPLPPGELLIRARGSLRRLRCAAGRGRDGVVARIDADAITAVEPEPAGGGVVAIEPPSRDVLRLINDTDRPARILVERAGWQADSLRARTLATLPDFVELFAADAPAAGMQLAIGELAVVFVDVVGSTQLYERIGDARAFALIQEHWRAAADTAAAHDGAVVKSLGDGLLMTFRSAGPALAATLEILDDVDRLAARHELPFAVRVGLHEGPCYLVRVLDRADLFGRTVNLASRLATVGTGQQIAALDRVVAHPSIVAGLGDDLVVEHRDVQLRGVGGSHRAALIARADRRAVVTGRHAALDARPR